jgi:hypothetical protein
MGSSIALGVEAVIREEWHIRGSRIESDATVGEQRHVVGSRIKGEDLIRGYGLHAS